MNPPNRFSCPSCGRTIYNRRNTQCEFCAAHIPVELAYSAEQLAIIDADHARNEQVRARLAREAEEREQARAKRRET
jgi:hypothetical protein